MKRLQPSGPKNCGKARKSSYIISRKIHQRKESNFIYLRFFSLYSLSLFGDANVLGMSVVVGKCE
jgi:hypothetical protein